MCADGMFNVCLVVVCMRICAGVLYVVCMCSVSVYVYVCGLNVCVSCG